MDLIPDAGRLGAKAVPHGHCALACLAGCPTSVPRPAGWDASEHKMPLPGGHLEDIFLPTALTLRFPLVPVTSEHSSANTYLPDVMSHNTVPLPSSRAGLTVFLPGSLSLHLNRVTFRSPSNYCASARTRALCYRLTPARCGEAAAGEPRSVWAAKCLISCLKARQAQASPCYPLLVSPPHSGIPVPPVEITGERFPRFPRYPVCRSRDL